MLPFCLQTATSTVAGIGIEGIDSFVLKCYKIKLS